jgi:hypothetical protein
LHGKLKAAIDLYSRVIREIRAKSSHNLKKLEAQLIERIYGFDEMLIALQALGFIDQEIVGEVKQAVDLFCQYVAQVLSLGVGEVDQIADDTQKFKEMKHKMEEGVRKILGELPLMVSCFRYLFNN